MTERFFHFSYPSITVYLTKDQRKGGLEMKAIRNKELLSGGRAACGLRFMDDTDSAYRFPKCGPGRNGGRLCSAQPSSTTLLVLSVMPTLNYLTDRRITNPATRKAITVFVIMFSAFMVIGRLISGVHWATDIIGSVLLSSGLFMIYRFMAEYTGKEKPHRPSEVSNGVQ